MDFVIEHEWKVLPIEIKSGKDYKRHNALCNVLHNGKYAVSETVVLSGGDIEVGDNVICLPIYMLMHLKPVELNRQVSRFYPL